jgi:hypothetical protein
MSNLHGRRIGAAVVGVVVLGLAAFFTIGAAIAAAVGMLIGSWIANKRGADFTRLAGWISAVAGVGVVIVVGAGAVALNLPKGSFAQIQQSADSARAASKPPAWLERLTPGVQLATRRAPTRFERALTTWGMIMGILLGCAFLATILGTLGWIAAMPLAYALSGRWLLASAGGSPPAQRQTETD